VLNELRARSAPFQQLSTGMWMVFIAISTRWQSNEEAWPSQETIARFCGCTARCVRTSVAKLVLEGILRLRRTRTANGTERLYYSPGPTLRREIAALEGRFPRERAKPLRRALREEPAGSSTAESEHDEADLRSGGDPDLTSRELTDQDLEPSSSSESADDAPPTSTVEQLEAGTKSETESETEEEKTVFDSDHETPEQAPVKAVQSEAASRPQASVAEGDAEPTEADRDIARVVLGERLARKFPDRALPRWFERGDVEQVARCTMLLDGDREAKISAHRGALDAAFAASRNGPPTVKFVWGSVEHFLAHVDRGRVLARKLAARLAARVDTSASSSTIATSAPTSVAPPSADARAKMRADMARLFGADFARPSFATAGLEERAP
jgi:hypothetical protein